MEMNSSQKNNSYTVIFSCRAFTIICGLGSDATPVWSSGKYGPFETALASSPYRSFPRSQKNTFPFRRTLHNPRRTNKMAVAGLPRYFRYRFLGNNRQTPSKATKWVEDGNGNKVRFTNEYSYSPTQIYSDHGDQESLGNLLRTAKGKCLFHAEVGHGQVCGPHCIAEVFHAEKDYHRSLELRETKEMGIGVFTKQAIPKGAVLGLYSGAVCPCDQLTPA